MRYLREELKQSKPSTLFQNRLLVSNTDLKWKLKKGSYTAYARGTHRKESKASPIHPERIVHLPKYQPKHLFKYKQDKFLSGWQHNHECLVFCFFMFHKLHKQHIGNRGFHLINLKVGQSYGLVLALDEGQKPGKIRLQWPGATPYILTFYLIFGRLPLWLECRSFQNVEW